MQYLRRDCIDAITNQAFQSQKPYPWLNIPNSLTDEAYEALRQNLPEVGRGDFRKMVGVKRGFGQKSHDRYLLHYLPHVQVAQPWQEFLAELQSDTYHQFLHRVLGVPASKRLILTFEWYYAWQGCAVSPHCDAHRKLATHIFYFNTKDDWKDEWGGQVLMLDDEGKFKAHSAPDFDQFKIGATVDPRGNGSLFFQRTDHSWHGVRPLQPPPDNLRKLFIITVNIPSFQVWWRRVRGKDPDGYRFNSQPQAA